MATVPWLADVLRAAGLTVVEHAGWRSRAAGRTWFPQFGIVHATAAPRSQPDETQVRIVRDGREGLPGPIANACVDRSGVWHVLAVGRCNTTLPGTAGPYEGKGNTYAFGVEACNDNRDEPWPPVQYRSYARGWAAIARRLDWPSSRLRGHREHTPQHKSDPTFDMAEFRRQVAEHIRQLNEGIDMAIEPADVVEIWSANAGSAANPVRVLDRINQVYNRLATVLAAVHGVDEAVMAKLADPGVPTDQRAAAVRTLLGDDADAVIRVLAGQLDEPAG